MQGKNHQCLLSRRLGGPLSQSGCFLEENFLAYAVLHTTGLAAQYYPRCKRIYIKKNVRLCKLQ